MLTKQPGNNHYADTNGIDDDHDADDVMQATVKEPAIMNMRKGITMAYCLISSTYFTVAVSGYWAFGQTVLPYLLNNLTTPTWPVTIANIAAIIQITGCYQVTQQAPVWLLLL
jgi:hypothetical protein